MSESDFAIRLDQFLEGRNAIGCTQEELDSLADRYSVQLPDDYKTFLRRCGRGAAGLWRGSDYTIDRLDDIQVGAVELLQPVHRALPFNSLVFFMHQGYQFFYLCDGGVFFYLEGQPDVEWRHATFRDFFEATADLL